MLTNIVHQLGNISLFDSVFISTLIINGLILLLLLLILYKQSTELKVVILVSYIASILNTYTTSDMMAPFLYYIRYLPSVLLALLMFHAILKNYNVEKNNYSKFTFLTLLLLVAIYNFEYAILTVGALGAASIIKKNKFYFLSASFAFLGIVFIKIISHLYLFQSDITVPVRYLNYFSQLGLVQMDYRTTSFLVIILLLLSWFWYLKKKMEFCIEYYIILLLLLFLNIKVVWIFAFNHVGPLFLLVGLIIASNIIIAAKNSKSQNKLLFSSNFFGKNFLNTIIIVLTLSGFANYNMVKNFTTESKFDNYSPKNTISSIFKISVDLVDKLKSVGEIYQDGDLVMSPNDNAIAIYLGKKVTKPFADLSTNINYDSDIPRISKYYFHPNKSKRIIVDKYIDDKSAFNFVIKNWSKIPRKNEYFRNYEENLVKFRTLFNTIKPLLYKCGENQHFSIYCYKI